MPEYHLLQNKEHDEVVATPSSIGTRTVNPRLSKWISALACFLCGCIFAIVSIVAGHHVLSNETGFAGDMSFLSMFLEKASAEQIAADWGSCYSSSWAHLQRLYSRRQIQGETVAGE